MRFPDKDFLKNLSDCVLAFTWDAWYCSSLGQPLLLRASLSGDTSTTCILTFRQLVVSGRNADGCKANLSFWPLLPCYAIEVVVNYPKSTEHS